MIVDDMPSAERQVMNKILWVFIFVVVAGVAISITSASELLAIWAPSKWVLDIISKLVPSVNQLAGQADFPEVARVVISLSWLAQPFLFAVFAFWLVNSELSPATLQKYRKHRLLLVVGVLVLVPSGIAASWFLIGNKPIPVSGGTAGVWIERGMIHSRFVLGLVVSLIALTNALMAALAVNFLANLPKLFGNQRTG